MPHFNYQQTDNISRAFNLLSAPWPQERSERVHKGPYFRRRVWVSECFIDILLTGNEPPQARNINVGSKALVKSAKMDRFLSWLLFDVWQEIGLDKSKQALRIF